MQIRSVGIDLPGIGPVEIETHVNSDLAAVLEVISHRKQPH